MKLLKLNYSITSSNSYLCIGNAKEGGEGQSDTEARDFGECKILAFQLTFSFIVSYNQFTC